MFCGIRSRTPRRSWPPPATTSRLASCWSLATPTSADACSRRRWRAPRRRHRHGSFEPSSARTPVNWGGSAPLAPFWCKKECRSDRCGVIEPHIRGHPHLGTWTGTHTAGRCNTNCMSEARLVCLPQGVASLATLVVTLHFCETQAGALSPQNFDPLYQRVACRRQDRVKMLWSTGPSIRSAHRQRRSRTSRPWCFGCFVRLPIIWIRIIRVSIRSLAVCASAARAREQILIRERVAQAEVQRQG